MFFREHHSLNLCLQNCKTNSRAGASTVQKPPSAEEWCQLVFGVTPFGRPFSASECKTRGVPSGIGGGGRFLGAALLRFEAASGTRRWHAGVVAGLPHRRRRGKKFERLSSPNGSRGGGAPETCPKFRFETQTNISDLGPRCKETGEYFQDPCDHAQWMPPEEAAARDDSSQY